MVFELGISAAKLVDWLCQVFNKVQFSKIENRRRYFFDHIEPTFTLITAVHKDYIENFQELLQMLKKEKWATVEIADWLKKQRATYASERERMRLFPNELKNSNYYSKLVNKRSKDSKIYLETFMFALCISYYYNESNSMEHTSWYSRFIEEFESNAYNSRAYLEYSDEFIQYTLGVDINEFKNETRSVQYSPLNSIEQVANRILPAHYRKICEHFSNLKGLCLM